MNTRLSRFLAAENITQSQFADSIGVARASISHIISGRNKPSYEFIAAMMKRYPQINPEWLILGTGKMYKDPANSAQTSPAVTVNSELLFPVESADSPSSGDAGGGTDDRADDDGAAGAGSQNTVTDRLMHTDAGDSPAAQPAASGTAPLPHRISRIIVLFEDGSFQELRG